MPNRNAESYFSEVPRLHTQRSIFKRPVTHKTSFNVSELIPVYVDQLYPGDGVKVKTSKIVRLQTMLTPVMDSLYLDTFWFFVPMRLTWTHTKEFVGENTQSAWLPSTEYQIPSISSPSGGFQVGTIADHMGFPVLTEWSNTDEARPQALPFRGLALICNEFFRDEDLTDPLNIPLGDANQTGSNGSDYINDVVNGGKPFKVAKYHDIFTSATKEPQKGPTVTFPLIADENHQWAPVGTTNTYHEWPAGAGFNKQIRFRSVSGASFEGQHNLVANSGSGGDLYGAAVTAGQTSVGSTAVYPVNLWADLSTSVGAVTINQLRLAIQLQSYYERLSIIGSRMTEIIRGIWGLTPQDARLQRPEYLGGNRIALNVHEVINQAQATQDFLGDLGAMSRTVDVHFDIDFQAQEWGYLYCLVCARYDHTYTQGFEPWWNRLNYLDLYNPYFSNIGYTPLYQHNIMATPANMQNKVVFGYNEAWSDLRFGFSKATAEMRPGVQNSLASWHFADYYETAPTLSDSWIREDLTNVDRTLAVSSSVSNQLFADFFFDCTYTRVLPMYSVPGIGKTF